MAPSVEPIVLEIYVWPHFQAVKNGQPLIGGKLWTYAANSTLPKAAFFDPFFVVAHENPIILNDQGAADIYLKGFYHLFLTDAEGVQLWDVPSYTFSSGVTPSPGQVQVGTSQVTLHAINGAGVLLAGNLVPAGYRVLGVRTAVTENFGTSQGLQRLLIGDHVAQDRWGVQGTLTAVAGTTQAHFHAGDCPIAPATGYTVLLAAEGGQFDSNGAIVITAHWERLLETAGDPSSGVELGAASVTVEAEAGLSQLAVGGLVPAGARVLGVTTAITESFGTSQGLQALLVGDDIAQDRWGHSSTLEAHPMTSQGTFQAGDCPIAATPYTIFIAAEGGQFDANGALEVTVFWSILSA